MVKLIFWFFSGGGGGGGCKLTLSTHRQHFENFTGGKQIYVSYVPTKERKNRK